MTAQQKPQLAQGIASGAGRARGERLLWLAVSGGGGSGAPVRSLKLQTFDAARDDQLLDLPLWRFCLRERTAGLRLQYLKPVAGATIFLQLG